MTDSAPKQLPPYGLRIPLDLKESLQKSAKDNNRSMHAEIIDRLERSFDARPAPVDREWMSDFIRESVAIAAHEMASRVASGEVFPAAPSQGVERTMDHFRKRWPELSPQSLREIAEELERRRSKI